MAIQDFTLDERTAISNAFSAGNYANAYETDLLDVALGVCERQEYTEHERNAFILGFYASYALSEIFDRDDYDAAYYSPVGEACRDAGYIDDRATEYHDEEF